LTWQLLYLHTNSSWSLFTLYDLSLAKMS
jgi:hypothetical protein